MCFRLLFALTLCIGLAAAAEIEVDGIADEALWRDASSFGGLVKTQPETGEAERYSTTVRYLSLPEGLAFFFSSDHPTDVPRRAPRQQRDNLDAADRVNVMVDFDANGQRGYNFTVSRANSIEDATITTENQFNKDWDALWFHAVHERDGGWDAELLIPWSSVFMRPVEGDRRQIGLYVDRVIGDSGERGARPPIVFFKPQFLSLFERIEIAAHQSGLLRFYPYVSARADVLNREQDFQAGLDLFYKPSSSFQLTAAFNPDFGQVEADDLVVNFDAVEIFFSDKRPFFTENQGPFILQSPEEEPLIYTRRIGSARDDGQGVAQIDAGLKLNGSLSGLDYGVFAVREGDADEVGKQFSVLRLKHPGEIFDIGYLGSLTERPFLDRTADVHAVDVEARLPQWVLRAVGISSRIDQPGQRPGTDTGYGHWATALWTPSNTFDARFDFLRFDEHLDYNDAGFQRRPDYRLWETRTVWRFNNPDPAATWRTTNLTWNIDWPQNDRGRTLQPNTSIDLYSELASGASAFGSVRVVKSGVDDRISRGNGAVRIARGLRTYWEYNFERIGDWRPFVSFNLTDDDLFGKNRSTEFGSRRFFGDALSIAGFAYLERRDDRLFWREGTRFGRYRTEQGSLNLDFEWFAGARQELRGKLQWVGLSARDGDEFLLQPSESLRRTGGIAEDFGFNSFGVQLRYRYKLGPESDVFVVYARGGESGLLDDEPGFRQFDNALTLRDADQLLVKLRYAF